MYTFYSEIIKKYNRGKIRKSKTSMKQYISCLISTLSNRFVLPLLADPIAGSFLAWNFKLKK